MAIAKDLIVLGSTRLSGDVLAGTIFANSFKMIGSDNQHVLLGDGTDYPLSAIASTAHTHLVTINGATKSIGATSVDLGNYLPIAGGTMTGVITLLANQYADTAATGALNANNSDLYNVNSIKFADASESAGEGLQWYRDASHVDSMWVNNGVMYFTPNRAWGGTGTNNVILHSGNYTTYSDTRYVKLDAGAAEQTIKSSISSLGKGVIDLWRNSGDHYTFLGFSNGATEKYLGGIGFKSQSDHEIYLKRTTDNTATNTRYFKILHAGNIGLVATDGVFEIDPHTRKITSTKTDSAWNAQVYSTDGYADGVILSFKFGQTNAYIMVGLNTDAVSSANYQSIDYCFYGSGSTLYIYESGTNIGSFGTYTTNDEFRIEYRNGKLRYYKNGALIRSVSRGISGKLYFDSSFNNAGYIYDFTFTLGSVSNNIDIIDLR